MPATQFLILATSLDPESRSQILARRAHFSLEARGVVSTLIDLRELPAMPLYGVDIGSASEAVTELKQQVLAATHLVFSVPIYNWDVNAAAKNLVEHLGSTLKGKTVGFLCAAGGQHSYMSVMSLANSLMLDFRCWINPRFVYATGTDFTGNEISSTEVLQRIDLFLDEMT